VTLKLGVLISGTGTNLGAILDAIDSGQLDAEVKVVISNRPEAKGLERAKKARIPTEVVDHRAEPSREAFDHKLLAALKAHGVEWTVLAGFMRVLTPAFLEEFKGRVLNIHPSLLPAFRGVDAQKQAHDYGVRVAGCTVHFVIPEVDAGAILVQRAVQVGENESLESLKSRILVEEHIAYVEALRLIASGRVHLVSHETGPAKVHYREPTSDGR
jgi:phosphoribosylglycinamide formyltransferase 1